jgi:hypothetical protein
MADSSDKDTGVLMALFERFEKQRLPRALALKEKVDGGAVLSDEDLAFLNQVFEDAQFAKPYLHRHPEIQPLVGRAVELYKEITDKALANEKAAQAKKP